MILKNSLEDPIGQYYYYFQYLFVWNFIMFYHALKSKDFFNISQQILILGQNTVVYKLENIPIKLSKSLILWKFIVCIVHWGHSPDPFNNKKVIIKCLNRTF